MNQRYIRSFGSRRTRFSGSNCWFYRGRRKRLRGEALKPGKGMNAIVEGTTPMKNYSDFHLMILEKRELTCEDVEALLGDYVDRELPETLHKRVKEHTEQCSSCQQGEVLYRQVIGIARDIGREKRSMPDAVKRNLRKELNKRLGLSLG